MDKFLKNMSILVGIATLAGVILTISSILIAQGRWQGATDAHLSHVDDQLADVKNQITDLDNKIDSKITDLDNKIDSKITELDNKIDSKITDLDNKLSTKIDDLSEQILSILTANGRIGEQDVQQENPLSKVYIAK